MIESPVSISFQNTVGFEASQATIAFNARGIKFTGDTQPKITGTLFTQLIKIVLTVLSKIECDALTL
jgi:hypothetical protein